MRLIMNKDEKAVYEYINSIEKWCQLCGSTFNLHRHHIYYRSELGLTVPKNIIVLCEKCHRKVHSNKKVWQPHLLELQYKRFGYFTREEVTKCKKYGNL